MSRLLLLTSVVFLLALTAHLQAAPLSRARRSAALSSTTADAEEDATAAENATASEFRSGSGSGSGGVPTSTPTNTSAQEDGSAGTSTEDSRDAGTVVHIQHEELTTRLLSDESSAFIGVTSDGLVHAQARRNDPSALFYVSYPFSGVARFESASYPGRYLKIDIDSNTGVKTLRCGQPSSGNDLFTITPIVGDNPAAYGQGDCFIAFDYDGEPYGPCGLTASNYEAHIRMS